MFVASVFSKPCTCTCVATWRFHLATENELHVNISMKHDTVVNSMLPMQNHKVIEYLCIQLSKWNYAYRRLGLNTGRKYALMKKCASIRKVRLTTQACSTDCRMPIFCMANSPPSSVKSNCMHELNSYYSSQFKYHPVFTSVDTVLGN